jgi:hypothetical protein
MMPEEGIVPGQRFPGLPVFFKIMPACPGNVMVDRCPECGCDELNTEADARHCCRFFTVFLMSFFSWFMCRYYFLSFALTVPTKKTRRVASLRGTTPRFVEQPDDSKGILCSESYRFRYPGSPMRSYWNTGTCVCSSLSPGWGNNLPD